MSMERILTEQRNARDLLLAGHPDQEGLRMKLTDWVSEEIALEPGYASFLSRKRFLHQDSGFECGELNKHLFDWQIPIVKWALRKGRASIFADFQHCPTMAFVGLSDSFEQVYQAERRCWRFGQKRKVTSYVITSEAEGAVVRNQERKLADYEIMSAMMVEHMRTEMQRELGVTASARQSYNPEIGMEVPKWLKSKY